MSNKKLLVTTALLAIGFVISAIFSSVDGVYPKMIYGINEAATQQHTYLEDESVFTVFIKDSEKIIAQNLKITKGKEYELIVPQGSELVISMPDIKEKYWKVANVADNEMLYIKDYQLYKNSKNKYQIFSSEASSIDNLYLRSNFVFMTSEKGVFYLNLIKQENYNKPIKNNIIIKVKVTDKDNNN